MKKIICFIIFLSLLFSGCINSNNKEDNKKSDMTQYKLKIQIILNTTENYVIYAPIFVLNNGTKSIINEQFKIISGNADFQLIDTKFGPAISINSSKNVTIELNGTDMIDFSYNDALIPDIYLSLNINNTLKWETNTHNYWMYCNNNKSDNIQIIINVLVVGEIGDTGKVIINQRVISGWNSYRAEMSKIISPI